MEEKLKKIDKEIEEKELDLAIRYNEGYTDDSQEIQDIMKERDELYNRRQTIIIEEKLKEIDKKIEKIELDLAIKYNEGYTDDSPEVKDIMSERDELYKSRQEILKPKDMTQENKTKNDDKSKTEKKQSKTSSKTLEPKKDLEPEITEGIAKEEIKARIEKYKEQQKKIWADGPDVISDKDRREFDRINNVMGILEELLKKHPNSEFVALEDINAIIYDSRQEANDIWREVSARGDGAISEENSRLTKLNDIVQELKDFLKTQEKETKKETPEPKEGTGYAEGGFQPPAVQEFQPPVVQEFQPPMVLEFPKLDLDINKKTGEVRLTQKGDEENSNEKYTYLTFMDAYDYTQEGLKIWKNTIQTNENIAEEDKKYIEKVDPTIYNAYLEWDRENDAEKKYGKSAAGMYVKAVIARAKNIEKWQDLEEVEVPGNITVDINWKRAKSQRPDNVQKFSLKNWMASRKANKILKGHDKKHMDLATVKSGWWKKLLLGTAIGATLIGGSGVALLNQGKDAPKGQETSTEKDITPETPESPHNKEQSGKPESEAVTTTQAYNPTIDNTNAKDQAQNKQKEAGRLYPGDIVTPEQHAMIFESSDAKQTNGTIGNANQAYGVNKMAVVIGDKIYSTDKYSTNELYDMAKNNPNASIKWHVDKAIQMNGRMVVETHEVGNPSPIYIYNDNGIMKTADDREWNGDVKEGIGWISANDLAKANENEVQQIKNNMKTEQVAARSKKQKAKNHVNDTKQTSTEEVNNQNVVNNEPKQQVMSNEDGVLLEGESVFSENGNSRLSNRSILDDEIEVRKYDKGIDRDRGER